MVEMHFIPLAEFQNRLEEILGESALLSISKMLESEGIIENDRVDLDRLQVSLESIFHDAGSLLITAIMEQSITYSNKPRASNQQHLL
jgi:hypothetical protein